jgi:hypothetical protein
MHYSYQHKNFWEKKIYKKPWHKRKGFFFSFFKH